jgi:hypothetical protein
VGFFEGEEKKSVAKGCAPTEIIGYHGSGSSS